MSVQVHATAVVHEDVVMGEGVSIGPYSVIEAGVELRRNVTVGSHCQLGTKSGLIEAKGLTIGSDSIIRSHSVIYDGSTLGSRLTTGHHASIREGTVCGEGLQVGSYSDIQGDCSFGEYVKLHSNVHVGKGSRVNDFVWLFPFVVLTNDPHPPSDVFLPCTVEPWAVVATGSILMPGVTVGQDALVGAGSVVTRDVERGTVVSGSPAKVRGKVSAVRLRDGSGRPAYPWRNHFSGNYPPNVMAKWPGLGDYEDDD